MGNQRFSVTQAAAVEDERITDGQYRTLGALGVFGDKSGWCFPSLKLLSTMLHKSPQMVSRDVKALEAAGYIQRYPQFEGDGTRKPNKIRLLFDTPLNPSSLAPSTSEVEPPSTPVVETPSTSEVEVNAPVNAPINDIDNSKELSVAAKAYFTAFNRKRWANPPQAEAFAAAEALHGEAAMLKAIEWAALNNIPRLPAIFKCAAKIAKQSNKPAPSAPAANGTRKARW